MAKLTNETLAKIDNRLCLYMGDCHEYSYIGGIKTIANICKQYNIDYLWSLYDRNKEINKLKSLLETANTKTKFICINNCIRGDIFRNYKTRKIYDIVLFGNIGRQCYPLRTRLYHLFKTDRFQNNFRIKIIEAGDARERKLAKILNQSYLGVATCSKYDYLVKKYFEISGSNCLLLGNMPDQGKPIFRNRYIKLNMEMTNDQIFTILKNTLRDKKKILNMANTNYKIVHNKHLVNQFYKRLYTGINK